MSRERRTTDVDGALRREAAAPTRRVPFVPARCAGCAALHAHMPRIPTLATALAGCQTAPAQRAACASCRSTRALPRRCEAVSWPRLVWALLRVLAACADGSSRLQRRSSASAAGTDMCAAAQVKRASTGASGRAAAAADSDSDEDGPQARREPLGAAVHGTATHSRRRGADSRPSLRGLQAPPQQELYPESRLQMAWPNVFKARRGACSALARRWRCVATHACVQRCAVFETLRCRRSCAAQMGAGLNNLGNTCFLNSVLQCLTYTPPLALFCLAGEHRNHKARAAAGRWPHPDICSRAPALAHAPDALRARMHASGADVRLLSAARDRRAHLRRDSEPGARRVADGHRQEPAPLCAQLPSRPPGACPHAA
jgi:hypothetical protein